MIGQKIQLRVEFLNEILGPWLRTLRQRLLSYLILTNILSSMSCFCFTDEKKPRCSKLTNVYKVKLCLGASKTWTSFPSKELVLKVIKIINTSNNYLLSFGWKTTSHRCCFHLLLPPLILFVPSKSLNFILILEIIRVENMLSHGERWDRS